MRLAVFSVGPYRVREPAGLNQWRGSPPEGAPGVRVCLVEGAVAEAAAARRGFTHARLFAPLHVEAGPAGVASDVPGGAFVVVPEPGGPSLREAVARGGPLAPAAAASLALLLAEPLRALGERGLGHGGVSPDSIFLPAGERAEPALGLGGFDADARRAYRPPGAEASPAAIDRWGLVGCLWFALRGAPPGPAGGRHTPSGRRGGRGPGSGGREALEAIGRRGLAPREGDRYPDWITLMIELGAWLERYGAPPPAGARRGGRPRAPPATLDALDALDASARQTLSNEWPKVGPALAPPALPTPGPWSAGDEEPVARAPESSPRRAPLGRRSLVSAALIGAGVIVGGGAVWLGQRAPAEGAREAAAAAPVEAVPAPTDPSEGNEMAGLEAPMAAAGARLVAPLRNESPEAINRCVSAGFAPHAFDPGYDFRPLCAEPDATSAARQLQRALAAGNQRTREGSAAMREWSHYGWYELAAAAALRDRCCGDFPPTRVPPTPPPCASLHESLGRVGVAANAASEPGLDLAIDDYHQRADCVAREGYASLYGRAKGVQRWEETNFRVFVRRFRRAAGGGARGPSTSGL